MTRMYIGNGEFFPASSFLCSFIRFRISREMFASLVARQRHVLVHPRSLGPVGRGRESIGGGEGHVKMSNLKSVHINE